MGNVFGELCCGEVNLEEHDKRISRAVEKEQLRSRGRIFTLEPVRNKVGSKISDPIKENSERSKDALAEQTNAAIV